MRPSGLSAPPENRRTLRQPAADRADFDSFPGIPAAGIVKPLLQGYAPRMFTITEADTDAILAAFDRDGELAAVVELRRRFPGLSENAGLEATRMIVRWRPAQDGAPSLTGRLRYRLPNTPLLFPLAIVPVRPTAPSPEPLACLADGASLNIDRFDRGGFRGEWGGGARGGRGGGAGLFGNVTAAGNLLPGIVNRQEVGLPATAPRLLSGRFPQPRTAAHPCHPGLRGPRHLHSQKERRALYPRRARGGSG